MHIQKVSINEYSLFDSTAKSFVNQFIGLGVTILHVFNEELHTVSVKEKEKNTESENFIMFVRGGVLM